MQTNNLLFPNSTNHASHETHPFYFRITSTNGIPYANRRVFIYAPGWFQNKLIDIAYTDRTGLVCIKNSAKHLHAQALSHRVILYLPTGQYHYLKAFLPCKTCFTLYKPGIKPLVQQKSSSFAALQLIERIDFLNALPSHELKNLCSSKNKLSQFNTIDLLLNGMCPSEFKQIKFDQNGHLNFSINWSDNFRRNRVNGRIVDLRKVKITLEKNRNSRFKGMKLKVKQVSILTNNWGNYRSNHRNFRNALFLFNSATLVNGILKHFICYSLLIPGQISFSLMRTLDSSPIKKLLQPHLKGISKFNHKALELLMNNDGLLHCCGFSETVLMNFLKNSVSSVNYQDFIPTNSNLPEHNFGLYKKLAWQILVEVTDRFFKENHNEIIGNWYEIHQLSQDLINNQVIKDSFAPITRSESNPKIEEIENLKKFCQFTLFFTIFYSHAIRKSLKRWGTNQNLASISPRIINSNLVNETPSSISHAQAAYLLAISESYSTPLLLNTSVYQPLIESLIRNKNYFKKIGYEINKLLESAVIPHPFNC